MRRQKKTGGNASNKGDKPREKPYVFERKLLFEAKKGNIHEVRSLLNKGVNVNAMIWRGTAFTGACQNGHIKVAELLLSKGADIEAENAIYVTSLERAALDGYLHVVEFLLENGATKKDSALTYSVIGRNKEIVELLLRKGADVNIRSSYIRQAKYGDGDFTPLHHAASIGDLEISEVLVDYGADINAKTSFLETTPLMVAAEYGRIEVIDFLLKKGAKLGYKNIYERDALLLAIDSRRNRVNVVELLLNNGARADVRYYKGSTALHHAAMGGDYLVYELLKKHGAEVSAKDDEGATPLITAAQHHRNRMVYDMLTKGI